MKPSREEIEEAIGGELPEGVELEFGDSEPESSDGFVFELVVFIKNKFEVFKKTLAGHIVTYYIVLHGLGIPIPSPYQVVCYSMDRAADYSQIVYERAIEPMSEPPEGFLVALPIESPMPPSGQPLSADMLPTGTEVYPLSAHDFRDLTVELG